MIAKRCICIFPPYELQETLWSCIVISSFISKVDFAHIIDTSVDI